MSWGWGVKDVYAVIHFGEQSGGDPWHGNLSFISDRLERSPIGRYERTGWEGLSVLDELAPMVDPVDWFKGAPTVSILERFDQVDASVPGVCFRGGRSRI